MTRTDLKTRLADPPPSPEEARAWGDEMLLAGGWTNEPYLIGVKMEGPVLGNPMWRKPIGNGATKQVPANARPNPVTSMDAAMAALPSPVSIWRIDIERVFGRITVYITGGKTYTVANGTDQSAIARAICIAILEIG